LQAASDNLWGHDMLGCWVWIDTHVNNAGLFGSWLTNNGLLLWTSDALGTVSMSYANASLASPTGILKVGRWHHVVGLSVQGSAQSVIGKRLWIDGNLVATNAVTTAGGAVGAAGWEIGSYANDAGGNLDGRVAHAWAAQPMFLGLTEDQLTASVRRMYKMGMASHIPHGLTVY
jgi:hypothetical protein